MRQSNRAILLIFILLGAIASGVHPAMAAPRVPTARLDHPGFSPASVPASDWLAFGPPTALPPIQSDMADAEYDRRVTALKITGTFDAVHWKSCVVFITQVMWIKPNGPADQAGLKIGDLIFKLDGQTLNNALEGIAAQGHNRDAALTVLTLGQPMRDVTLPAGEWGARLVTLWEPLAAWAQEPSRDARFDSFVLIASVSRNKDPELALAALARAQKAGCDEHIGGYVIPGIACLAAFSDCRFDEALAFGAITIREVEQRHKAVFATWMKPAAAATFKLPYWFELQQMPGVIQEPDKAAEFRRDIEQFQKLGSRVLPDPLDELKNYAFEDASLKLSALFPGDLEGLNMGPTLDALNTWGTCNFTAHSDHFAVKALGPAGRNVDVAIYFTFKPSDEVEKRQYGRAFAFGLVNQRGEKGVYETGPNLCMSMYDYGGVEISRHEKKDFVFTYPHLTKGLHRGRIIAVGPRYEIILDGRRVARGIVREEERDRNLGIFFQATGLTTSIASYSWRIAGVQGGK